MEENGKLVSFIYADREVITVEDEAGEHIRYIRGHELLASDSERARTYYHYACDEMGSITDITDCHGTVLNHYAYDAFGNRTVNPAIALRENPIHKSISGQQKSLGLNKKICNR